MTSILIFFIFLLAIGCFFTKDFFWIYLFVFFTFLNSIHYQISVNSGNNGYSVINKGILDDELIFFDSTKRAFENEDASLETSFFGEILFFQKNNIGYDSINSLPLCALIYILMYFFGTNILIVKFLISFFASLVIYQVYILFRNLKIKRSYAIKYSLFFLFYPSLIIRSVQVEKDVFILYFSILLINLIVKNEKSFKIIFNLILLSFFRFYFAIGFIVSYYLKYFKIKNVIPLYVLFLFLSSSFIIFLKEIMPDLFNFIYSIKKYSVLNGYTNIIDVDYSNFNSIIWTLIQSSYYYFLGPISGFIFNSTTSIQWKLMAFEPLIFFLIPTFYLMFNSFYKFHSFDKFFNRLIIFVFLLSFSTIIFESHFTSIIRKRILTFIIITVISIYQFHVSSNKSYQNEKN